MEKLEKRMDAVLDKLFSSRTPISAQDELREELLAVYEDVLAHAAEAGGLSGEHAYFFTILQSPTYRDLLDDELLAFVGAGTMHTLQSENSEEYGIETLQERLDAL